MAEKKAYDSTVARIAGNLLSGVMAANGGRWSANLPEAVTDAVVVARAIVAETKRTEPELVTLPHRGGCGDKEGR